MWALGGVPVSQEAIFFFFFLNCFVCLFFFCFFFLFCFFCCCCCFGGFVFVTVLLLLLLFEGFQEIWKTRSFIFISENYNMVYGAVNQSTIDPFNQ